MAPKGSRHSNPVARQRRASEGGDMKRRCKPNAGMQVREGLGVGIWTRRNQTFKDTFRAGINPGGDAPATVARAEPLPPSG